MEEVLRADQVAKALKVERDTVYKLSGGTNEGI